MSEQSTYLECKGKTVHIRQWGLEHERSIVLWHGVTGTSRDHEQLARRLATQYRVISPDAIGCGLSEWPDEPLHTSLDFHVEVCDALLPALGVDSTIWIGTSKGGALGMLYGAYGSQCQISKLILHDVGPGLPKAFRDSLASHIAAPPAFASMQAFKAKLQRSLARQGLEMSKRDWEALAQNWYRRRDDGLITYHYSPGLAWQFEYHAQDYDLWHAWDKLQAPTLLIRGEHSVIISDGELQRMQNTGAKCALHTRNGGHMSFLQDEATQQVIFDFLS